MSEQLSDDDWSPSHLLSDGEEAESLQSDGEEAEPEFAPAEEENGLISGGISTTTLGSPRGPEVLSTDDALRRELLNFWKMRERRSNARLG